MRLASVCFAALVLGCGARTINDFDEFGSPSTTTDSGTTTDSSIDTGSPDTRPPPFDTGTPPPDTRPPPMGCEAPLSPGFSCLEPPDIAGKKVCTDAAIRELSNGCFGPGATSSKCNAAMKKFATCSNCMLNDWVAETRLQTGACIKKVDPTSKCGTVIDCTYDCLWEVCNACDDTPGTGKGGGSEMDDCYESAAYMGSCYDLAAKDYTECASDPKLSVCIPNTVDDLITFYRGACRDGGDWSKATVPDGT
jgi:hypothetical protein